MTIRKPVEFGTLYIVHRISYLEHKRKECVKDEVQSLAGAQVPLLDTFERHEVVWSEHMTRHNSLCQTIMHGIVQEGRRIGRQRKSWLKTTKNGQRCPCPGSSNSGQ
ncbi:hypothetical protein ElyMa_003072400 [Elysia marginata]|uniref:Uncharacterized protein n=1 Tax=Elysia marginata TaxID=1093978 RepID=A0AAV4IK18_9GAST|nr:hypothetical protein ElyMa_003072400 [Elysia marginata]